MFLKLAGGVSQLTDALAAVIDLRRITAGQPAIAVEAAGTGWTVRTEGSRVEADAVVLATPAFESARLLGTAAPAAVAGLTGIPYASTGVVFLIYPEGTAEALPHGSGFVVPAGKAPMTACTWLSNKWPREEYGSRAVVRCYVGGVGAEELVDEPDEDILEAMARHLAAVLPVPERPESWGLQRWRRAMPQYEVGHLDRVRTIRAALPSGIFVAGSAFGGVGISDSIRDATETAAVVRQHLVGLAATKETVR